MNVKLDIKDIPKEVPLSIDSFNHTGMYQNRESVVFVDKELGTLQYLDRQFFDELPPFLDDILPQTVNNTVFSEASGQETVSVDTLIKVLAVSNDPSTASSFLPKSKNT